MVKSFNVLIPLLLDISGKHFIRTTNSFQNFNPWDWMSLRYWIDIMNKLGWQQANSLLKGNPNLHSSNLPWMSNAVNMRVDKEPFTDINVRKELILSFPLQ